MISCALNKTQCICPFSEPLFKTLGEWEKLYFNHARLNEQSGAGITRDYINDLGQKLYVKLSEVIQSKLGAIREEECINYAYDFVLNKTYAGYSPEITTIYGQLKSILGVEIHPAPDEWDRGYNVDFFIKVKDKYIGLQIKPAGYAYIPQIVNELEFQKKTHQKFTEKYGGKVFYIISVKQDKKKVIHNPEVIDEIKKEIGRLQITSKCL
ncbi:MAG: MjaI family restriction endonuclease [Nitrospirae bacterium]|nr:MjaI family restriction endonuclease [Nitrospirota bacterium]MBI4838654.1 MjaI family restriction endonuclease [Nitrospirota bacterium]